MMTYEQLERCYKTVMKQRDEAETKAVDLECKLDDALSKIEKLEVDNATLSNRIYTHNCRLIGAPIDSTINN